MQRNADDSSARRRLEAQIQSLRSTADALERRLQALDAPPAQERAERPRRGSADAADPCRETPLPIAAG